MWGIKKTDEEKEAGRQIYGEMQPDGGRLDFIDSSVLRRRGAFAGCISENSKCFHSQRLHLFTAAEYFKSKALPPKTLLPPANNSHSSISADDVSRHPFPRSPPSAFVSERTNVCSKQTGSSSQLFPVCHKVHRGGPRAGLGVFSSRSGTVPSPLPPQKDSMTSDLWFLPHLIILIRV